MTLPAESEALADALADVYRQALAQIQAEIDRVAAGIQSNPLLWRRRERLDELYRTIAALLDRVDDIAAQALDGTLRRTWTIGADDVGRAIGHPFAFAQPHADAIALLAQDLHDELLQATRHVRRQTKAVIRDTIRPALRSKDLTGRTAADIGRRVADQLRDSGIGRVTYKNGARHTIDTYARMATRTKSAVAYNAGALNHGKANGVEWWEVFDGTDCGWLGHQDADKANGTVRSTDECASVAISHPNCVRSYGPRPDVTSKADAEKAKPSTTAEQRADQLEVERAREAAVSRRQATRARTRARDARQEARALRRAGAR